MSEGAESSGFAPGKVPAAFQVGDQRTERVVGRGGQYAAGGFLDGPGQSLASAPYRPDERIEVESVCQLARDWINANRRAAQRRD